MLQCREGLKPMRGLNKDVGNTPKTLRVSGQAVRAFSTGGLDIEIRKTLSLKFSVLMSVYHRESPTYLEHSLGSLVAQTRLPDEVVIIKDGLLGSELDQVISRFSEKLPTVTLDLRVNRGLGRALRAGVEHCRFEWIARMDSDDICLPGRFKRQLEFLEIHPEIDVLGSGISEFQHDPGSQVSLRCLPEKDSAIRSFSKFRNPVNHMTVMFRKQAVLEAGNYQEIIGFEDYDLWVRMLMLGVRFHNLQESLVFVRCGNGMQRRRGGLEYLLRELRLLRSFHASGFISTFELVQNALLRVPARMVPASIRGEIYRRFLRSEAEQPA
jgi:glycosyltransferase involved in cell wall biosynthesis